MQEDRVPIRPNRLMITALATSNPFGAFGYGFDLDAEEGRELASANGVHGA
jgi:hypothetical protein